MKNLNFKISLAFISVFAFISMSCTKSISTEPIKESDIEFNNFLLPEPTFNYKLSHYFDFGLVYFCAGDGGNCLPEITIKPSGHLFKDLKNAINNKEGLMFIKNNYKELSSFIHEKTLDLIIKGKCYFSFKGHPENKISFLLLKNIKTDSIELVYQFRESFE